MCSFLLCTFLNIANEYMNILLLPLCNSSDISLASYEYSLSDCIFQPWTAAAPSGREKTPLLHIRILLNNAGRPRPAPAAFDTVLIDEWGTSVIN